MPHSHDPHQSSDADDSLDPAAGLELIAAQGRALRHATEPDGRVLFGIWGAAWLVGYLVMYIGLDGENRPAVWSGVTFATCLMAAIIVTAVHISRRTAGMRGASSRQGTFYGMAWFLGFVLVFVLLAVVGQRSADIPGSGEIVGLVANGVSALVVALLYMAGGAMWEDYRTFALGVWIAVVTTAGTLVGLPGLYLVMALAGGGGFLVAAGVEAVRPSPSSRVARRVS